MYFHNTMIRQRGETVFPLQMWGNGKKKPQEKIYSENFPESKRNVWRAVLSVEDEAQYWLEVFGAESIMRVLEQK